MESRTIIFHNNLAKEVKYFLQKKTAKRWRLRSFHERERLHCMWELVTTTNVNVADGDARVALDAGQVQRVLLRQFHLNTTRTKGKCSHYCYL